MKLCYILIPKHEENQLEKFFEACPADKYFYDVISSTQDERQNFHQLFDSLNQSDELICYDINHICLNGEELIALLQQCQKKHISFTVSADNVHCKAKDLELFIFALTSLRTLERNYHLKRQKEGVQQAAELGIFAGRPKIDLQKHMKIYEQWKRGEISAVNAAKAMNLSRATFYRRMSEFEELIEKNSR